MEEDLGQKGQIHWGVEGFSALTDACYSALFHCFLSCQCDYNREGWQWINVRLNK